MREKEDKEKVNKEREWRRYIRGKKKNGRGQE